MGLAEPFNFSLRASNDSIVRGCPGVQRTFPRVEGLAEIRSNNGLSVVIRKITVSLVNTQEITVPSSSGIGSSSAARSFTLFTAVVYSSSEEVLGADVPFILPIPQDAIASGEIAKFSMVNKTTLKFVVTYGNKYVTESTYEFPVPIKKYNTLPIYRQFVDPGVKIQDSPDRLTMAEYSMPHLCVGPGDPIEMNVRVSTVPGTRAKKIKLKKAVLELLEVVEFHDGGFQDKVTRIATTHSDFSDAYLTHEGQKFTVGFACPSATPWKQMISAAPAASGTSAMRVSRTLGKINSNVPLSHVQGFTVIGKLFSIRYELHLRLKLSGAKDIESTQQLVVSPFDIESSIPVLKWILQESDNASRSFGANFEANLEAALKRAYQISDSHLALYKSSSGDDWVRLGLGERAFKTRGRVLDYYID